MKELQLVGFGNAITDIFLDLKEDEFSQLGLKKGSMGLVGPATQKELLERFAEHSPGIVSGGSVGNSTIAFSQLGGCAGFLCSLGRDSYGEHYLGEFNSLGIKTDKPFSEEGDTGTSIILITPDGERTMQTSLGIASSFTESHISEELISSSEWLFVEGYLFANPESGQEAALKAISIAKEAGTKVALTFSDGWVVEAHRDCIERAIPKVDFVFANENEAKTFAAEDDRDRAFEKLATMVPGCAVTHGPDPVYVSYQDQQIMVQPDKISPRDLTGAGDMFAGALLYGLASGTPINVATKAACNLSGRVIRQVGARLNEDLTAIWKELIDAS